MTLNFMTKFNKHLPDSLANKPTHFVDKIWFGLQNRSQITSSDIWKYVNDFRALTEQSIYLLDYPIILKEKIHTIRNGKRWRKGMIIHFKIWTGMPYKSKTFAFAPEIECASVQRVFMTNINGLEISVDGKYLSQGEIQTLAINDGFDDLYDFEDYFFPPKCEYDEFSGQIIHWTDFKY